MKTKFKFLLALLALAFVTTASAQLGAPAKLVNAGSGAWTNKIAGSTSVTNNTRFDIGSDNTNVALEWTYTMAAGGATNQIMWIGRNNTGSTTMIEPLTAIQVVANGTGTAQIGTNLSTGGFRYLYITTITNGFATGGHYMTNYVVTVNAK